MWFFLFLVCFLVVFVLLSFLCLVFVLFKGVVVVDFWVDVFGWVELLLMDVELGLRIVGGVVLECECDL